jgi:hypothetical protein
VLLSQTGIVKDRKMTDDTRTELMLPILRQIQSDQAKTFRKMDEFHAVQVDMRVELHAIRGEQLRQMQALASLENDMDRVKRRLDLIDEIPPQQSGPSSKR